GPKEDCQKYPRQEKKDEIFAKKRNIDIIFYPSEKEMYPRSFLTYIEVDTISQKLCGKFRPNHFKGVTTIIAKLLNIVEPDNLYLGQKDFQQAIILKKMICDLNIPVRVRVCPTIREKDGLALSSRNKYLSKIHRLEAPVLYKALKFGKKLIKNNQVTSKSLCKKVAQYIQKNSSAKIQYVKCIRKEDLTTPQRLEGQVIIMVALYLGKTRLIDNIKCKI
ncbi:Pantoate--beta-alanine ligase, partial [hydrothermal vent metagenome]